LLDVGGARMIDRVASALRPIVDDIVVVSAAPDAASWLPDTRVVRDVLSGDGSAAGIHAALATLGRDVLVVAWDMPFVTERALRAIADSREGVHAVVPAHANGMLEPLCAWYDSPCIDAIAQAWDAGDRSAHGIVNRVRATILPASVYDAIGGTARLFFNVNTPADLDEARRIAADASGPPA
jgi:molybdopterin-guanine dinucleotide biosynthesis protein A